MLFEVGDLLMFWEPDDEFLLHPDFTLVTYFVSQARIININGKDLNFVDMFKLSNPELSVAFFYNTVEEYIFDQNLMRQDRHKIDNAVKHVRQGKILHPTGLSL